MQVSIERKRPTVKKFFGGTKEADYESAFVTIHFSEDEKATIESNRLGDRIVYEHPKDEVDYRDGQRRAVELPNSYGGQHPPPRYKRSRFVAHFIADPTQEVYAYLDTPLRFAEIQKSVEANLKNLKALMQGIESVPKERTEFEI
ncbi:MAG: hypothetical protein ABL967_20245 [Bryobacteraceae bacterium]